MTGLFYLMHGDTKKKSKKVLKFFICFAMALVVAMSPVICNAGILGTIAGTVVSGAAAVAGAPALAVILAGLGVTVGVSLLEDAISGGSFSTNFNNAIYGADDNYLDHFEMAGAGFCLVVDELKKFFGINENTESGSYEIPGSELSQTEILHCSYDISYTDKGFPYVDLTDDPDGFTKDKILLEHGVGYFNTPTKLNENIRFNYGQFPVIAYNSGATANCKLEFLIGDHIMEFSGKESTYGGDVMYEHTPIVIGDKCYIPVSNSTGDRYFANVYRSNADFRKFDGHPISYIAGYDGIISFVDDNGIKQYICLKKGDKTIYKFDSFTKFNYKLFIENYNLATTPNNPATAKEEDYVVVNTPKGTKAIPYSYDKNADVLSSIRSNTTADSTVKISAKAGADTIANTKDIAITDAVAETITETGTISTVKPSGGSYWTMGINLVRTAGTGITDKFPFSMAKDLKKIFTQMNGNGKITPNINIPINLPHFNIKESINLNFSKIGNIAKYTDWAFCGVLIVGLVFATKKLFF